MAMIGSPNPRPQQAVGGQYNYKQLIVPLILVTSLFFMWGVANNLNDILIAQFKKSFALSDFQSALVQSAFYLGYFCFSVPAAMLMRKYGYKSGILIGLLLYGVGALLFYPAAEMRVYGFFLTALFVIASGLAFLETAANPYVTMLGAPETADHRINLAQSFNPLGAISGILIGRYFIFSGNEYTEAEMALMSPTQLNDFLVAETRAVQMPYLIIGLVVLFWAALVYFTKFPEIKQEAEVTAEDASPAASPFSFLLGKKHFVFGVIAQFLYVGAQVGIWSYMIRYAQFMVPGTTEVTATDYLTFSLVLFMIGRFIGTALIKYISAHTIMAVFGLANVALTLVAAFIGGTVGMYAMVCTSFFMSVMFPTIFSFSIKGLGAAVKLGSSIVIMAIVGGAVLTAIMGYISDQSAINYAMVIPTLCYIYITWYSVSGSKVRETA